MYTATDRNKCGDVAGAGNSHLIVKHISMPHCRAQPGMKLVLWTSKQHCYTLIQQFIIQKGKLYNNLGHCYSSQII